MVFLLSPSSTGSGGCWPQAPPSPCSWACVINGGSVVGSRRLEQMMINSGDCPPPLFQFPSPSSSGSPFLVSSVLVLVRGTDTRKWYSTAGRRRGGEQEEDDEGAGGARRRSRRRTTTRRHGVSGRGRRMASTGVGGETRREAGRMASQ